MSGFGDCRGAVEGGPWTVRDVAMTEHPRITYQCSKRVFDRLFKGTELLLARISFVLNASVEEQSLDETKNVVRKKLGLGYDTAIELAQVRDGRRIDLEDGASSPQFFTKISIPFRR